MKSSLLLCFFTLLTFIIPSSVSAQNVGKITIDVKGQKQMRETVYSATAQNTVEFCGLQVGMEYKVYCTANSGGGFLYKGYDGVKSLTFTAFDACRSFTVVSENAVNGQHNQLFFSVSCQNCPEEIKEPEANAKSMMFSASQNLDATDLVQNIFIGGDCFETSGASVTGNGLSVGDFTGGTQIFGFDPSFDEGIVLSTGLISNMGANSTQFLSSDTNSPDGNGDLSDLAGGDPINDVVVLEFDFVPTVDMVQFDYAFASEEYCDFAPPNPSSFNDVFGFFLSGPGIAGPYAGGAINIAQLANGDNVSINNINPVTNSGLFVSNGSDCGVPGAGSGIFAFDGYTTTLTAVASVIPCETYHIRLAIGDAVDGIYDSAVFLKANSFDAGSAATGTATVPLTGSSDSYESASCGQAAFTFTREGGDITQDAEISYEVSGSATVGVDYTGLPPSPIIIPAFVPSVTIFIDIVDDDITEGVEDIILFLFGSCTCDAAEVSLNIFDLPTLDVDVPDAEGCEGFPAILVAEGTGGVAPYFYDWGDGGGSTPSPVYTGGSNTENGSYTVTVTDFCGAEGVGTGSININSPSGVLDGAASLCGSGGDSGTLEVNLTGSDGPFSFVYSIDGVFQEEISGVTESPYLLEVNETGTYALEIVTTEGCLGEAAGTVDVVGSATTVSAASEDADCAGTNTGSIDLTVNNADGAVTFLWSNGSTLEDQAGLPAGDYSVTVNAAGCEIIETFTLAENPPLSAEVVSTQGVDCASPNDGAIDISATGGNGTLTYLWSNGATTQDLSGVAAGTFTVTVTDADDCEFILPNIMVTGSTDVPTAAVTESGTLDCNNSAVTLTAGGSSTGANISYTWTDQDGTVIAAGTNEDEITVNDAGTYTLTVTNTDSNCFAEAPVNITVDAQEPTANAGAVQTLTCNSETVQLNGTASSNGTDITYAWTGPAGANITAGDSNTPTVDAPGTYTLTVTDSGNGCSSTATVTVDENTTEPTIAVNAPEGFGCDTETVGIDAGNSSSGGFSYQWTSDNGATILGATTLTPTVNMAGDYDLVITNNATGCTAEETVSVPDDTDFPEVSIATPDVVTCAEETVQLDASASDSGDDFTVEWIVTGGSGSLDDPTSLTPNADGEGTFLLTVTDITTGCETQESITVTENTVPPSAAVNAPDEISCDDPTVTLVPTDAGNANLTYEWTVTAGTAVLSDPNAEMPTVDAPGTIQVLVTDSSNGCSASASVTVEGDPETPVAVLAVNNMITCAEADADISGTGSSVGGNFTYQWEYNDVIIENETSLFLSNLTETGDYTLTVINTSNGCEDEATITVTEDTTTPTVAVAAASGLDCNNDEVSVSGAGSETGDNISYAWTSSAADGIAGDTDSLIVNATAAGTYYLTVSNDDTGCTSIDSVTVMSNTTPPVIVIDTPQAITCGDMTETLNADVTATGGNISYAWTGAGITAGDDTATPTVDAGGTFTLTATDIDNGCSTTESITVDENVNQPTATVDLPSAVVNCFNETLTPDASASTGAGDLIYAWTAMNGGVIDENADTAMPTISAAGTYTVLITDTSNDCEQTAEVIVTEDFAEPTAEAGMNNQFNCGDESLTLNGAGSTNTDVTYLWTASNGGTVPAGEENNLSIDITTAGTYTLQVTSTLNGCSATDAVEIINDENTPVVSVISEGDITCLDDNIDLTATIDNVGANFDFTWTIENGDGNFAAGETTLTPAVDAPGTYILTAINNDNNCESSFSITVAEDTDEPTVDLSVSNIIDCENTAAIINTDNSDTGAGFSLTWTDDAGVNIPAETVNPSVAAAGNYTLTVTNTDNGCAQSMTVPVSEDTEAPAIMLASDEILTCVNETAAVNTAGSATGAEFTYEWVDLATGETVATTLEFTTETPGDFALTITDTDNSCTSTEQTTVLQDADFPAITIAAAQELNCDIADQQLDATGSETGATIEYAWTVIDGTGSITAGANTLMPTVDGPGTFELLVTNTDNDCAVTEQVIVTQDIATPAINLSASNDIDCINETATLQTDGTDTGANFDLTWTDDAGVNIPAGSENPVIDGAGIYTLTVTNTDNGCDVTETVTVTEDTEQPMAAAELPNMITCEETSVSLNGTGSSTGAEFTYEWTNLTTGVVISDDLNTETENAGNYQLLVTNTANGCTNTAFVEVTQDADLPTAIIAQAGILNCNVTTLDLDATGSSVGDDITYSWEVISGAGTITAGGTTLTPSIDGAGVYELTVTNSANNCAITQQMVVNEDLTPAEVNIAVPDMLNCTEGEITLAATSSNASQFTWTGVGNIDNADSANPTVFAAGTYTVTAINDATGCPGTASIVVEADADVPTADAGTEYLLNCETGEATLTGTSTADNASYVWTDADGNEYLGQTVDVPATGVYVLTVTDLDNSCTGVAEAFVDSNEPDNIEADIIAADCISGTGSILVTETTGGTPGYSYSLDDGETFFQNGIFTQLEPGAYDVIVQDLNGCEYSESMTVGAPEELILSNMPDMKTIRLGESFNFDARVNKDTSILSSIVWTPSDSLICNNCLDPTANPTQSARYTLTVRDSLGCTATASTLLVVDKELKVYIPTAFSPDNQGDNNKFMIYAEEGSVERVEAFIIYNRWGEPMYEFYEFPANDPEFAWDGTHRGQLMNTGVFAYVVKVRLADGRTETITGDVTLLR